MRIGISLALYGVTVLCELGGAFLMWRGLREGGGPIAVVGGIALLAAYGSLLSHQPGLAFGRALAAYGGVFIAGSLVWATVFDGFRPDRFDIIGGCVCLIGVSLIAFAPRTG